MHAAARSLALKIPGSLVIYPAGYDHGEAPAAQDVGRIFDQTYRAKHGPGPVPRAEFPVSHLSLDPVPVPDPNTTWIPERRSELDDWLRAANPRHLAVSLVGCLRNPDAVDRGMGALGGLTYQGLYTDLAPVPVNPFDRDDCRDVDRRAVAMRAFKDIASRNRLICDNRQLALVDRFVKTKEAILTQRMQLLDELFTDPYGGVACGGIYEQTVRMEMRGKEVVLRDMKAVISQSGPLGWRDEVIVDVPAPPPDNELGLVHPSWSFLDTDRDNYHQKRERVAQRQKELLASLNADKPRTAVELIGAVTNETGSWLGETLAEQLAEYPGGLEHPPRFIFVARDVAALDSADRAAVGFTKRLRKLREERLEDQLEGRVKAKLKKERPNVQLVQPNGVDRPDLLSPQAGVSVSASEAPWAPADYAGLGYRVTAPRQAVVGRRRRG